MLPGMQALLFLICNSCLESRVFSHPEENAESRGDAALQEELVRQIQRSMGKQRLIEAARRSVEQAEKDRLKSKLKDVSSSPIALCHMMWRHSLSK